MQRVSGGYTIVETMIFLAVTAALIAMAMTFLAGSNNRTRFSQSMRDLQSKIQDWINDVPTGFAYGTATNTSCKSSGGVGSQVLINNAPRVAGAPPECIFLGKAIEFPNPGGNTVYAYSVFGSRLAPTGDLAANLKEAIPVPAVGVNGTGTADLTEPYTISAATVKTITSAGPVGTGSRLAGFYLGLTTDQAAISQNGDSPLKVFQYPLQPDPGPRSASLVNCIENKAPCALGVQTDPNVLTSWQICFQSDSGTNTALLSILSDDGKGASTQLQFKAC